MCARKYCIKYNNSPHVFHIDYDHTKDSLQNQIICGFSFEFTIFGWKRNSGVEQNKHEDTENRCS